MTDGLYVVWILQEDTTSQSLNINCLMLHVVQVLLEDTTAHSHTWWRGYMWYVYYSEIQRHQSLYVIWSITGRCNLLVLGDKIKELYVIQVLRGNTTITEVKKNLSLLHVIWVLQGNTTPAFHILAVHRYVYYSEIQPYSFHWRDAGIINNKFKI